jgi:hypothetical protein
MTRKISEQEQLDLEEVYNRLFPTSELTQRLNEQARQIGERQAMQAALRKQFHEFSQVIDKATETQEKLSGLIEDAVEWRTRIARDLRALARLDMEEAQNESNTD